MLDGAFIGGLNPEQFAASIEVGGPVKGLSPDLNTSLSMNTFKPGSTCNAKAEGHRLSPLK